MLFTIIFIKLIVYIEAYQNQYQVKLENFTIDFIDRNLMDATCELVKIKNSTGLNFNFTSKINVSDSTMITATGYKIVGKNYSAKIFQLRKPIKEYLEMEQFDLQNLLLQKCRPPMVWPIIKGVEYHISHWVPNSTNFPANLPGGKWKIHVTQIGFDKSVQAVLNFYGNFEYYVHKGSV